MDARHFDALVRSLLASDSRRRFLTLLAMLPMLRYLPGLLSPEEAAAKDRRRRRKRRRRRNRERRKARRERLSARRRKSRASCRPEPIAQTCHEKCGSVTNTCGKPVDCGSCACNPACDACFICQNPSPNAPGVCVVDPNQQGEACGAPGQVCLAGGACACDAGSCPGGTFCCDGTCGPCPCGQVQISNGTCVKQCETALDCGSFGFDCVCFSTPDICGGAETDNPCPNGDVDCPTGEFCNGFNGKCVIACDDTL